MKFAGKAFVVVVFLMSALWMAFSVAIFATHKNYKDKVLSDMEVGGEALGLKKTLEKARTDNQELEDKYTILKAELDKEVEAKLAALTKLEVEHQALRDIEDQTKARVSQLEQQSREKVEEMASLQDKLGNEVDGLRVRIAKLKDQIAQARHDWQVAFEESVRLTDELHQEVNVYRALASRNKILSDDLDKAKQVAQASRPAGSPPARPAAGGGR
jgi:chromosome segregation ATPase